MTDQNIKHKIAAPFNVVSSSVTEGYVTDFQNNFKAGTEIVNYHEDKYGDFSTSPIQSPFTSQHVGGLSHRHVDINDGSDEAQNRQEAWHINVPGNSNIRIHSHKFLNSPPSYFSREELAKRPINIKNILTTTSSLNHGNYRFNYEIVQAPGRFSNSLIKNLATGSESIGTLVTRFIYGVNLDNRKTTAELDAVRTNTVIVSRFSAPGGANESSRASLDVGSEELSANNSLTFRNMDVRERLLSVLSQSSTQFNANNSFNGVNRNTLRKVSGIVQKDNFFVQRPIPRTDIQYSWISASALTTAIELGGYQASSSFTQGQPFVDIRFDGESDDRVFNQYRREYNIDLNTNLLEPSKKIDLSSYTSTAYLTGSQNGFSLKNLAGIRIHSVSRLPYIVLLGSAGSTHGIVEIEYNFTTPIELTVTSVGGTDASDSLGITDAPDVSEKLFVQISTDNRQTWTTHATLRVGSTNQNQEKTNKIAINQTVPYYVRITNDCASTTEGFGISEILANPLAHYVDNEDYSFSIWKQTRTGEHPVAKSLKQANIISVFDVPQEKFKLDVNSRSVNAAKRSATVTSFVDPPVTTKYKPLKHRFMIKGTTLAADEVIHSFTNNSTTFSNKELIKRLSLIEDKQQMYDQLLDFYRDMDPLDPENPISKFLGYSIKEVIYPKEQNTGLLRTRQRNKYILDKAGLDRNGFDRQFGTQRAFWRDLPENRRRSPTGSFNSQNEFIWELREEKTTTTATTVITTRSSLTTNTYRSYFSSSNINLGQNSIMPIDTCGQQQLVATQSVIVGAGTNTFQTMYRFENSGELNSPLFIDTHAVANPASTFDRYSHLYQLSTQIKEIITTSSAGTNFYAPNVWVNNLTGATFVKPQIRYTAFLGGQYNVGSSPEVNPNVSTLDCGLRYAMHEMTDKRPWFDSYTDFIDDIRGLSKDYTILPEFRISEHMEYYVKTSGGNFRAKNNAFLTLDGSGDEYRSALAENSKYSNEFFKFFINGEQIKNHDQIKEDNKTIANLSNVTVKVSGIKKLLPYNGFYPIQRTVQLANLYSEYINDKFHGGIMIYSIPAEINSTGMQDLEVNTPRSNLAFKQAALEPIFSPGILFNTIKAGLAVDWPAITGSRRETGDPDFAEFPGNRIMNFTSEAKGRYRRTIDFRIPFEAIIFPELGFTTKTLQTSSFFAQIITSTDERVAHQQTYDSLIQDVYCLGHFEPNHSTEANIRFNRSVPYTYSVKGKESNPQYSLAMSNFLAETVKFFLQDETMIKFASNEQSKWKTFSAGKSYYLDVVLKKTADLVMVEAFSGSNRPYGKISETTAHISTTMNGRYFGYPIDKERFTYSTQATPTAGTILPHNDPAYSAYTPPYFEGEAIMRLTFRPSETKKYTLDEIFSEISSSEIYPDLLKQVPASSSAYLNKMALDASINLFGSTLAKETEFDLTKRLSSNRFKPSIVRDTSDQGKVQWIISPKMETPVLDFSNQPFVINSSSYTVSGSEGFGRGMWSGYGSVPDAKQGIFLELRESFPTTNKQQKILSGSLLSQLGFKAEKKKIGQLADSKEISEAVVVIPYLDRSIPGTTINIDGQHFIRIDKNIFNLQKQNLENGDPAIKLGNLKSAQEIQETSISKMIGLMEDYIIPPKFNFITFPDIVPFVMYIVEFKHLLDQEDLKDIWQGLMPKIARTAEVEDIEFSHESGKFEFFHGKELPKNLRWMVFKVKKKGEKDYFSVTEDSDDDNRFKFSFRRGRKEPEYGYNWPYDYFSLVEFAKVEVELDYTSNNLKEQIAGTVLGKNLNAANASLKSLNGIKKR